MRSLKTSGNTIITGIPTIQPQLSSKCESLVLQDITKNTQRKKQQRIEEAKIVEREKHCVI